jgi:hypothetical protein
MTSLETLRQQAPRISPDRFLAYHPGCMIQYFDDTEAQQGAKASSASFYSPTVAARKQLDRCAVCFSLQAFAGRRSRESITAFRNLGVDVDLATEQDRWTLRAAELDRRKDAYLRNWILPFPLKPHWLIETRCGFHVIFRVQPRSDGQGIALGLEINRSLIRALHGDESAGQLTQVLRVPRFYQFNSRRQPFRCKLLIDNAEAFNPYDFLTVSCAIREWEARNGKTNPQQPGKADGQSDALAEGIGGTQGHSADQALPSDPC